MFLGIDVMNVYIVKLFGCWDGIIYKSDVEVDYFYNICKIFGLFLGLISLVS